MSQLHTWLGPVASNWGFWYTGWRSWLRRSRTSCCPASTRYIVRIEQGGTWPVSSSCAQTCAGGRSTNRSSCSSATTPSRSAGDKAWRGARRLRCSSEPLGAWPRRR
jgi:hypothetical protein